MFEDESTAPLSEEDAATAAMAAMADNSADPFSGGQNQENTGDRALSQQEIDQLLGVTTAKVDESNRGIRAMLDRALMSYERLPMLEIVFDRFVRTLSTSLRNLTSENVDIAIRSISSLRFGDYIKTIPMPALINIFKVVEWENFGLIVSDGSLIYSLVDVLFGGRKVYQPLRFDGRPFTQIEQALVKQVIEVILNDLGAAFEPLSPSTFSYERVETNPSFATIARPGDAAILVQLNLEMTPRSGKVEILFPYATLEPIRDLLLQVFMGEKFGKDPQWEMQMELQLVQTHVTLSALLRERQITLHDVMKFKVGATILLDTHPDDEVILSCDDVRMFYGHLGEKEGQVAVNITRHANRSIDIKEDMA